MDVRVNPLIACGARRSGAEVCFNARVKFYPDGTRQILACEAPIFKPDGWESAQWRRREPTEAPPEGAAEDGGKASPERAVRRAKAKLKDIALCTPFKYFVTLTLDPERVDRYDVKEITRHLNHWLDNQVRRKGLAYVLVPERHKDGAIHFHGFFNDALEAEFSGTIRRYYKCNHGDYKCKPMRPRSKAQMAQWLAEGGQVVYNLPGWSWGFTTAIELSGDYHKAVSYVCKYIGKDLDADGCPQKIGGRWYYSGGELGRPVVDYRTVPLSEVLALPGSYSFSIPDAHLCFAMAELKGGETYVRLDDPDGALPQGGGTAESAVAGPADHGLPGAGRLLG